MADVRHFPQSVHDPKLRGATTVQHALRSAVEADLSAFQHELSYPGFAQDVLALIAKKLQNGKRPSFLIVLIVGIPSAFVQRIGPRLDTMKLPIVIPSPRLLTPILAYKTECAGGCRNRRTNPLICMWH